MTFQEFKLTFDEILLKSPLPNNDIWDLQRLGNTSLWNKKDWMEVLYRTHASYQCNHGHHWKSSWTMILFRFRLNRYAHFGRVRMKRFGQRCNQCMDDDTYHVGFCSLRKARWTVECLLLYILQRCYEGRSDSEADNIYYTIPVSDVRGGRYGGTPHQKDFCEACAHNQCQNKFIQLTKKKT